MKQNQMVFRSFLKTHHFVIRKKATWDIPKSWNEWKVHQTQKHTKSNTLAIIYLMVKTPLDNNTASQLNWIDQSESLSYRSDICRLSSHVWSSNDIKRFSTIWKKSQDLCFSSTPEAAIADPKTKHCRFMNPRIKSPLPPSLKSINS